MKQILSIYDFIPAILLVLQTLIILAGTMTVLRLLKILQLPYAGMEYSKLIQGSAILISVMIISFADIDGVVQSVKTFHSYGNDFYKNVFTRFSQFMLLIIVTQCLFGLLYFTVLKVMPGFRKSVDKDDDIPGAILKAVVMIIFSILLYSCAKEIIATITPKYISFN